MCVFSIEHMEAPHWAMAHTKIIDSFYNDDVNGRWCLYRLHLIHCYCSKHGVYWYNGARVWLSSRDKCLIRLWHIRTNALKLAIISSNYVHGFSIYLSYNFHKKWNYTHSHTSMLWPAFVLSTMRQKCLFPMFHNQMNDVPLRLVKIGAKQLNMDEHVSKCSSTTNE